MVSCHSCWYFLLNFGLHYPGHCSNRLHGLFISVIQIILASLPFWSLWKRIAFLHFYTYLILSWITVLQSDKYYHLQGRDKLSWIGQQGWRLLLALQKDWHICTRIVSLFFVPELWTLMSLLSELLSDDMLASVGNPKVIHRDIKAANILLDFNFEAKVTY